MAPRKKVPVPNLLAPLIHYEELAAMLQTRMYTVAELLQLGITEIRIQDLRSLNFKLMYQYEASLGDYVYYIARHGEEPHTYLPRVEGKTEFKIVHISDVHIGSNEFDEEGFIKTMDELMKDKPDFVTISGDLIDGVDIYKGHTKNVALATIDAQVDRACALLSRWKATYIACKGNHHRNDGSEPLETIEREMVRRGIQFTALKSNVGYICLDDKHAFKIMHVDGSRGNATSEVYGSQKNIDNFNRSTPSGFRVYQTKFFDDMYDIIGIAQGHWHMYNRIVLGIQVAQHAGTFQQTTDFIARRGIRSKTGCRTSHFRIEDDRVVSDKGTIVFSDNIEAIREVESQHRRTRKLTGAQGVVTVTRAEHETDPEVLNELINRLRKARRLPFGDLGLSSRRASFVRATLSYINALYNLNIIATKDKVAVWRAEERTSYLIRSPAAQSGIAYWMDMSNALIGSTRYSEEAHRYMLDEAVRQGIRDIRYSGDMFWGYPLVHYLDFTSHSSPAAQVEEFVRVHKDYPELHIHAINGNREYSTIHAKRSEDRFDCMKEAASLLAKEGIACSYFNSPVLDIVQFGQVFRMNYIRNASKAVYTADYPIVKLLRLNSSKQGNTTLVRGNEYLIGTTNFGFVASRTIDAHMDGTYVTSTNGPSFDPQGICDLVAGRPSCRIERAVVNNGVVVKFESEIVLPPV